MHHLGMDFVGPISPTSTSGNHFILTISDYFTKFAWAKALPTEEAAGVASSLKEVNDCLYSLQLSSIMGLPAVITTDRIPQPAKPAVGIEHRLTTAYYPQANGLDERFNQTLINSLTKFAHDNRDTWDENLGEVVYSYSTAVQESTKHTPFESMFGRVAVLPVDINTTGVYNPEEMVEQFAEAKEPDEEASAAKRQRMEANVKANIDEAQKKQKLHCDRKHAAGDLYAVGSQVLKNDFRRKKRNKVQTLPPERSAWKQSKIVYEDGNDMYY